MNRVDLKILHFIIFIACLCVMGFSPYLFTNEDDVTLAILLSMAVLFFFSFLISMHLQELMTFARGYTKAEHPVTFLWGQFGNVFLSILCVYLAVVHV